MTAAWARDGSGGVVLEVLAQPRSSRSRVVGEHDGRLKIQLAAPPVEGEANEALLAFLAAALSVKRADVALLAGETGRRKRVRVAGVTAAAAAALLLAGVPAPAAASPAAAAPPAPKAKPKRAPRR